MCGSPRRRLRASYGVQEAATTTTASEVICKNEYVRRGGNWLISSNEYDRV
jgi:hypothetical protein